MATKTLQIPLTSKEKNQFFRKFGNKLSRLGKALMFPIAVLPVAAICMRVGAAIPTGTAIGTTGFSDFVGSILSAAGNAVFSNLAMLFAIGVAFGLSVDSRGEAAIVAFVCMALLILMMSSGNDGIDLTNKIYGNLKLGSGSANIKGFHDIFATYDADGKVKKDAYDAILANNVLNGIAIGTLVSYLYNHFKSIELPTILGFFSGRRLIPIIGVISTILFGILWAIVFPWLGYGIYELSRALGDAQGNRFANAGIMFAYGILNRLMIPFGLHLVPNTLFWFTFGEMQGADGKMYYGDINIFINGLAKGNHSGTFQSGFFTVFMFGLPALVAAIWYKAEKPERAKVLGLLGGGAIISFFTGITEPVEFTFLYAAPMLFVMHAVLTGVFGFITGLFGIQLGFGFSAGFFDYVLSIPKSMQIINANKTGIDAVMANPAWIFVIGIVCALTYFFSTKFLITKFNLATPGRNGNWIMVDAKSPILATTTNNANTGPQVTNPYVNQSQRIIQGVGGIENIETIEWCATRLRFILKDSKNVDTKLLKMAGALGSIAVGGNGYQVIMGPKVEQYGDNILAIIAGKIKYNPMSEIEKTTLHDKMSKSSQRVVVEPFAIKSPASGEVISLKKVKDEAFASGMVGDGVAIIPSNGKFYSPVNGRVETVFPTKHAYGITTSSGVSILIHIGIDTNKLNGKGFTSLVKQGQYVKIGDPIAIVDIAKITSQNCDLTTPIIVTKGELEFKLKNITSSKTVANGDELYTIELA